MLYLDINGTQLLLPAKATAQVEHVNPLFADGVEDSFSLPLEVPAEGNEEVLGHVHVLPLAQRPKVYERAYLGHDGQPLFPGKLHVLSTTERSVRTTFIIDALVSRLRGVMLPDVLANEEIDLTDELVNQGISYHYRPSYRDGGKCQFPMFLAPELYGDANPDWKDRAQDYDATREYAINEQIRFTTYEVVERTEIWRCREATTAGQTPLTHPAKWDKAQYAVVNAWDRVANQHHYNTTDGNFYTFVPWFYLKWVLSKAMAHIGFVATGEFMDDQRYDELVLPNLTTIDPQNPLNGDNSFYVRQTDPVNVAISAVGSSYDVGWQQVRVPCQAESPLPYQDPDGMWNTTTNQWTCLTAGVWNFRVRVTMNRTRSRHSQLRLQRADGSTRAWVPYTIPQATWIAIGGTAAGPLTLELMMAVDFASGEVGDAFHLQVIQVNTPNVIDPTGSIGWPNAAFTENIYTNCSINAWWTATLPVLVPDQFIHPKRHVPQVPLLDWVLAVVDLFNLELVPDELNKKVTFNYKQNALVNRTGQLEDASERMVGTTEVDLQRSIPGYVLSLDMEKREQGEEGLEQRVEVMTEYDLPYAARAGRTAVAIATKAVYESFFRDGLYVWRKSGYWVPDVVVGERENAREVRPALKPLHMTVITKDDRSYQVPVINGAGVSPFFGLSEVLTDMYVCEFKKQRAREGGLPVIPGARSWGYGWDDGDRSRCTLELSRNDAHFQGVFQLHWKLWMETLVAAEPVTMDLLVDGPWLRGKTWHRPLHIHTQHYLPERIPVEHGSTMSPMVSSGAYLYRLRPIQPLDLSNVPPPFLCAGPGYGSFSANAGAILSITTTGGYATARRAFDGTLTTVADGTGLEVALQGGYCLWASDDSGAIGGEVMEINDSLGLGVTALDVRGYASLVSVLLDSDVEEVKLPQASSLVSLALAGGGNSLDTLDLSLQGALETLDMVYAGTSLDLSGCAALRIAIISGGTLATVTPPPNATLQALVIEDAALDEASVDALLLACDETFPSGQFVVQGGTSAGPSTSDAVNAKLAALSMNLWTILVN